VVLQVIFKQGGVSDGMYFVMEGVVAVKVRLNTGEETEVRRIGQQGYFGELGLLTHRSRAASAYAVGDCKLAFLNVDAFERLLGPCQDIMKRNIVEYHNHLLNLFGTSTRPTN
jgi:cAMP-dependent protein kinase regulator